MLYENIDTYLKDNGITRTYVAKKAGISNSTMTAIMQGKRKLLATEYANICSALNVNGVEKASEICLNSCTV